MRQLWLGMTFFVILLPIPSVAAEPSHDFSQAKEILLQAAQEALASDNGEKRQGDPLLPEFYPIPVLDKIELLGKIAIAQTLIGDLLAPATFQLALTVAKEIKDEAVRLSAFEEIAKLQARAGDTAGALQTTSWLQDKFRKAISLSRIASAYVAAKQLEEARHTLVLAFLEIWPTTEINSIQSGIVIALARIGEIKAAEIFLEELDPIFRTNPLREIAKAKVQVGDIEGAFLASSQIHDGRETAWMLYEIGLHQAREGNLPEARRTFKEAFAAARSESKQSENGWVTVAIIEALAENGFLEDAVAAVDLIEGPLIMGAMKAVARGQLQAGDRAAAEATFQQLKQKANKLNLGSKTRFQGSIDSEMIEVGLLGSVASIIDEIRKNPAESYHLSDIVEAQAKAGDIQGARRTYQFYIELSGNRSMSYRALTQIAAAQARSGDLTAARETFREAVENEEERESCCPGHGIKEIARAQSQAGDVDGALSWVSKQTAPFVKAQALFGIALGILDQSDIELPHLPELFPESSHSQVFRSPE